MTSRLQEQFIVDVLSNVNNRAILASLSELRLPDCWLVAGCLFQTVWNVLQGSPAAEAIIDYDIFYFDASDLSEEGESVCQRRVAGIFDQLGVTIEAKNQARVHLWYESYFGCSYPPLRSACDGIDRFLVRGTCVGLRPSAREVYEVYAPNGLSMIYEGVLASNPLTDHRNLFCKKTQSYLARWPWLRVEE